MFTKSTASRIYINQGEFAVSDEPTAVISTILGSCVAVCLWDRHEKIGGMNHVVYSVDHADSATMFGHAVNGMELLINGLLTRGAQKKNLIAKVFGGAQFRIRSSSPGLKNAKFVLQYLEDERIPCVGGCIGGERARRLEYVPSHGHARQKLIVDQHVKTDIPLLQPSDVQLFTHRE